MKTLLISALYLVSQAWAFDGGTKLKTPHQLVRKIVISKGSHAYECTGTFIAKGIMITAAHCVNVGGKVVDDDSVIVLSTNKKIEPVARSMRVWAHPKFEKGKNLSENDVALIVFEKSVVKEEEVANIELSSDSVSMNDHHKITSYLSENNDLFQLQNPFEVTSISSDFIIHGNIEDKAHRACHGDSGSSLIRTNGNKDQIVGILSTGSLYKWRPFANKKTCPPNKSVNFAGIAGNIKELNAQIELSQKLRIERKELRKNKKAECLSLFNSTWNPLYVEILCSSTFSPKVAYACSEDELDYLNITEGWKNLSEDKKIAQIYSRCGANGKAAREIRLE